MIPTTEQQLRRAEWRRRAELPSGHPEEMTLADWKEAIAELRAGRVSSVTASESRKKEAPKVRAEELLKDW